MNMLNQKPYEKPDLTRIPAGSPQYDALCAALKAQGTDIAPSAPPRPAPQPSTPQDR